jgi:hypothetical protein
VLGGEKWNCPCVCYACMCVCKYKYIQHAYTHIIFQAEIIAGMVRASVYLPEADSKTLQQMLAPLVAKVVAGASQESTAYWMDSFRWCHAYDIHACMHAYSCLVHITGWTASGDVCVFVYVCIYTHTHTCTHIARVVAGASQASTAYSIISLGYKHTYIHTYLHAYAD